MIKSLLDMLFYAPVAVLLADSKEIQNLAAQGRKHLAAARFLGRMALGHTTPTHNASDLDLD